MDNVQEWLEEQLEYLEDEELPLVADGFDDAIIGLSCETGPARVVYSRQACIDVLVKQGMGEEEAEEYFSFNVSAAYVGEHTPLFVDVFPGALKKKAAQSKKLLA